MYKQRRSLVELATAIGLIAAPFVLPYLDFAPNTVNRILVWGLFGIGFDLLFGYTGLLSFGQSAFYGTGGFVAAYLLTQNMMTSVPLALLVGMLAAIVVGVLVGVIALRRTGIYFAMITVAIAEMFFYFLGIVVALRIVRSPVGAVLRAIRDNPVRAAALGHSVFLYKLTAFVIAAAYAGLAGGLLGVLQGFMPPDAFAFATSGQLVMQTAIGGTGTLFGPLVGAAVWLFLRDSLQEIGRASCRERV